MTWLPRTVRGRLTLWYAGALGLGLIAFAAGSLLVLARVLNQRSDEFLLAARGAFAAELQVEARELPTAEAAVAAALRDMHVAGTHVAGTHFTAWPAAGPGAGARVGARVVLHTLGGADGGRRVAVGNVPIAGRWWTVQAEQDRRAVEAMLGAVALAYAVGVPLLLAASVGVGYVLARRALAPVAAMSHQARAIGAATLHDRLPVANPDDELGELASVINALLGRLEAAFAQQRRFVADASHELRTPVAILLAEADAALGHTGRREAESRQTLRLVRDAGARLSRIVEDLVLLARADSGRYVQGREPLYLDELLADGVRAMQAVADARDVRLELAVDVSAHPAASHGETSDGETSDGEAWDDDARDDGAGELGAPYVGDPALIDRMLLNLLENAAKYSPAGGTVRVTLTRLPHAYRLAVADSGPGIAPEVQAHVFERFFRADRARARAAALSPARHGVGLGRLPSGAGLGLAIARWIAESHGGTLTLARSTAQGSEFVVVLPIPAAPVSAAARSPVRAMPEGTVGSRLRASGS